MLPILRTLAGTTGLAAAEIAQLDRSIVRERVRDGDYEAAITQFGGWMPRYLKPLFGRETAFGENNPDAVELLLLEDVEELRTLGSVQSPIQAQLAQSPFADLTYLLIGRKPDADFRTPPSSAPHRRLRGGLECSVESRRRIRW